VFELTMPTGHQHTIQAEPQPLGQWPPEDKPGAGHARAGPTDPDQPPLLEPLDYASDLAALLPEGEDPETFTAAEIDALLAA
jgi:hypothetical protein